MKKTLTAQTEALQFVSAVRYGHLKFLHQEILFFYVYYEETSSQFLGMLTSIKRCLYVYIFFRIFGHGLH